MMAFDMKGGLAAARRFCDRVRIFLLAASLGGVESLVVLPIYTSHYNMSIAELEGGWRGAGTVRMSVGLEDPEDLIEDLRQALAYLKQRRRPCRHLASEIALLDNQWADR